MTTEAGNLSFGYWVRCRRMAFDLTQAELGSRAGASAAMIRKIEADERRPSRELAEMLADVFALTGVEREAFLRAARQPVAVEALPATPPALLPRSPLPTAPNNLPAPLTSFVDRTQDLPAIVKLLQRSDVRLVTLIGPPGVGKTRLSLRAAELLLADFPDGVWFVDLAPITAPDLVLAAIAQQFGVCTAAENALAREVCAAVGSQRVLLVLDNCEQVIAAAPAIGELLRGCKRLKVLATSRIPLHLYGEHEYAAPPLSTPPADAPPAALMTYEAVELFVARVRQHQPSFTVDAANAADVLVIVRKLQGIPLAIELAAATLRRETPASLAASLRATANWVRTIQATARDLPQRQRTLADAIAWSYALLEPAEQRCLRRLGVFAGSFTREAAAAICADADSVARPEQVAAWLENLADHSLIVREPGRWRLLEMIREFARTQMGEAEFHAVQAQHADYFHRLAPPAVSAPAEMEADYYDDVAALRWLIAQGDAARAVAMCTSMIWFWETRGYLQEGQSLVRQVLALPGDVDAQRRIDLLFHAASLFWQVHDFASATAMTEQAIAHASTHGLSGALPSLYNLRGRIAIEAGALDQAEAALTQSLSLAQQVGTLNPGFPVLQLGEVAFARGDLAEAARRFDQADALLPGDGLHLTRAMLHTDRAELALACGDAASARRELLLALPHVRTHVRRLRYWLVTVAGLLLADAAPAPLAAFELLAAEAALSRQGAPISPLYQPLLVQRLAHAKTQIDAETQAAHWNAAQRWTWQEAAAKAEALLLDRVESPAAAGFMSSVAPRPSQRPSRRRR